MFDIGWTEMLLIGIMAVVVVGPKDLPKVMRQLSVWLNQARDLAHQFRGSLDEMVREADIMDEQRKLRELAAENTRLLTAATRLEPQPPTILAEAAAASAPVEAAPAPAEPSPPEPAAKSAHE